MRLFKGFIFAGIMLGVLYSCSPLKKMDASKAAALATYASQDYARAYTQLSTLIDNYKAAKMSVPNDLFLKAAECAQKIKNHSSASDFYSQALNDSVTVNGIKGYVSSIKLDDDSKLSSVLGQYSDFLGERGEEDYLNSELYANAMNNKDEQLITEIYPKLKTSNEEESFAYLLALENTGKKKEAIAFCNKLVKENPNYSKAKEWKAVYYYDIADEAYKKEMAKYNKNKTYTAYVYLKRDLKKVSENYRISKSLFEELRKENPTENKYIKYLKNIYLRLELKREAEAMDKLLSK